MNEVQKEFTSLVDEYVVLKLALSNYRPTARRLPEGYEIHGADARKNIREEERSLLADNFEHWSGPYDGKLKGWRDDSPIFVLYHGSLVAGLYLCSQNEFDENKKWGQVHYAFMHPEHRGKGVYSVLFATAVEKAKEWKLEGLILNSDRHLLPEVYLRWGAEPWKRLPKPRPRKRSLLRQILGRIC